LNTTPHNPYAAPAASLRVAEPDACYRDGKTFIVPFGADVPERCVKCDAPAELEKERSYAWHHPAWYLAICIGPLIYIIVALIARKRAKLAVGLCEQHRLRRRNLVWSGWAALAIGILSIFLSLDDVGGGLFALVACAGILLALILYFWARLLHATRITEDAIHLGGCGDAFLDGLGRR
jgi:hypothetical protein